MTTKTLTKEQYSSPLCEELRINLEHVIAVSPNQVPDYEDGGELS